MTFEHWLMFGLACSVGLMVWLGWFLSRRPKRGGYIHRR